MQHFDIITSQSSGGDSIGDSIDIFSMLSHSLQVEVARNISRTLVETCYVFEGCDGNFIDSICVLLREVSDQGFYFSYQYYRRERILQLFCSGCSNAFGIH